MRLPEVEIWIRSKLLNPRRRLAEWHSRATENFVAMGFGGKFGYEKIFAIGGPVKDHLENKGGSIGQGSSARFSVDQTKGRPSSIEKAW